MKGIGVMLLLAVFLTGCSDAGHERVNEKNEDSKDEMMLHNRRPPAEQAALPRHGGGQACSLSIPTYMDSYDALRNGKVSYYYSRGHVLRRRVYGERQGAKVRTVEMTVFQYGFDPETIVVKKGETVRISATSRDVPHGLLIKEYGIDVPVTRGESKQIEFVADRAGQFIIRCSVYCGKGHNQMAARLIVEE